MRIFGLRAFLQLFVPYEFFVNDPLTGKRRRTRYKLTQAEAETRYGAQVERIESTREERAVRPSQFTPPARSSPATDQVRFGLAIAMDLKQALKDFERRLTIKVGVMIAVTFTALFFLLKQAGF
jgi:hypothetical protein